MNSYFLIDVGTSTVKVYERKEGYLFLVVKKTFDFETGINNSGLSSKKEQELFDFFNNLVALYSLTNKNTKIYATGIFRSLNNKKHFIERFYNKTGLYFNIITHELEAFYLEKAWTNCKSQERMLVINIGGDTTEILFCENGKLIEDSEKLSLGVKTLLEEYPEINEDYNTNIFKSLTEAIKIQLPKKRNSYSIALYTGGELSYMKKMHYPLAANTKFDDAQHPFMINFDDYIKRNDFILSKLSISDLKEAMPQNPNWMKGAKACSLIAQTIFQYYDVKTIVPSDSNLIDGVNVQEAKNVVICGSFNKHLKQIEDLINRLKSNGITVLSPTSTEVIGAENDFVVFKNDVIINHNTWSVEELHLKAIDNCDFVIACNYDEYIGISTTFELEHAYRMGKKIVFVEDNNISTTFGKRIGIDPMPCEVGLL